MKIVIFKMSSLLWYCIHRTLYLHVLFLQNWFQEKSDESCLWGWSMIWICPSVQDAPPPVLDPRLRCDHLVRLPRQEPLHPCWTWSHTQVCQARNLLLWICWWLSRVRTSSTKTRSSSELLQACHQLSARTGSFWHRNIVCQWQKCEATSVQQNWRWWGRAHCLQTQDSQVHQLLSILQYKVSVLKR